MGLANPASGKKSSIEEKREGEVLNTCVKFESFREKRGRDRLKCVCVCSRCQEKHCKVSSRESKCRGWKVQADSTCCHLHNLQRPSRKERKGKRDRKQDRKATKTQSHNPAEVLFIAFMFAASFHHSVICSKLPHSKCFFPLPFC